MLPAVRELRTSGPYRLVRHPIYLAAILGDTGLMLAHPSAQNTAVCTAGIIAHVVRVGREERMWIHMSAYRAYRRRTRWRPVPCAW